MADTYIDPFETKAYGQFAREQMQSVCVGMIPELDGSVKYAIAKQASADTAMKSVLENQPKPANPVDVAQATETVRDVLVRFGKHLESHKPGTIDAHLFFQGEAPSVVARRRMVKLVASVGHVVETLAKHKKKVRESALWLDELTEAHASLAAAEKQQRSSKVEKLDVGPDVAAERLRWLEVYTANKALISGLLRHAGKLALLPLIFDDLAEVHRAAGVSDAEPAPGASGGPAPSPAPAPGG